jgi:preprotein translocase subunit SecF
VAVDEGFKNSYSAIIDGNVTTLITAIVLYIFGSGPIQGFATTLIIGILSSLFTAILVSRVIIEARLKRGKDFSVGTAATINAFTNTHFDFLKIRKVCYIISATLAVISIISFCTLGLQRGVDFTGGRSYVVRFDKDVVTKDVREAVIKDPTITEVGSMGNTMTKQNPLCNLLYQQEGICQQYAKMLGLTAAKAAVKIDAPDNVGEDSPMARYYNQRKP